MKFGSTLLVLLVSLSAGASQIPSNVQIELVRPIHAKFDLAQKGLEFEAQEGVKCRWSKSAERKPIFEHVEKTKDGFHLIVPSGTRLKVIESNTNAYLRTLEMKFQSDESVLSKLDCFGWEEATSTAVLGFKVLESGSSSSLAKN